MGHSARHGPSWTIPALALSAFALMAPVVGSMTGVSANALYPTASPAPAATQVVAGATWDGHNLTNAGTPAKAFSLSKGQSATLNFSYTQISGGTVTNATVEVLYLGIVLTTSKAATRVVGGPPIAGVAEINWSFGPLTDALQGVLELKASLQFSTGATAWTQSFYVFVKTPYLLESAAVIVFLILTVAELYWGIAAVRDARRSRGPPAAGTEPPKPWKGPAEGGASSSGASPASADGSSTSSPPPSSPPGSGTGGGPPGSP